jgi:para-aminobenzoate synthetase component 1
MATEPIIEEISSPPDPFTAFRNLRRRRYAFFLDSSCPSARLGRYSFIGCDPFLVLRFKAGMLSVGRPGTRAGSRRADPFKALGELMRPFMSCRRAGTIPFGGGAVGYFSYDLKDYVERLPQSLPDDIGVPDMMLGLYDAVIAYDHLASRCYISARGLPSGSAAAARRKVGELKEGIFRPCPGIAAQGRSASPRVESNYSYPEYVRMVREAKEYIRKGDIYQVNLSQRFSVRLNTSCVELYGRLRRLSPAPFAAYLDFGDVTVLSSSPERFLAKRGSRIETRPIKGTRPRGADRESDLVMERELAASPKDRAEHVMIVDLERNDLGRVSEYGSVAPTESSVIEKYANVFHMVSTVSGRLRRGVTAVDCLRAAFPGGSITGAPKIRSMEIIDSLENVRRSVYTGAIGYIGFDGDMDTSIAIRTFVVKGGRAWFHVGGGIVADSDPDGEYAETLDKAEGMFRALGVEVKREKVYS